MRVQASQLVSCAALTLAASISLASPTRVAAKPAHKAAAAVKRVEVKAAATARKPAPLPVKGKHAVAPVEAHPKPLAKVAEKAHPAPIVRPEAPPMDDVQVQHDRHQHFSAEPVAEDETPRQATRADFLVSDQPEPKVETKAEAKPVVAVVRPAAPKVVEPAAVVVAMQYDKRGHLVVPPALKGSHEILLHQNEMADKDGLDRIQDDADLGDMREAKLLVPVPTMQGLQLDERLPANRRYCRPWTAEFLTALARAHYAKFHSALQVNSAVRTVEFQQRLLLTNGNAAPAEGETASPHLTGQAVDLAKHGLSLTEIAWLRGYLLPLVQAGKVDVEEEFQQACFHVSVYRKYLPQPAPPRNIAPKHSATAALATAIR